MTDCRSFIGNLHFVDKMAIKVDKDKKRMMIQTRHKISLLQEISIFTTDEEGSLALDKVLTSIHEKYKNELPINSESNESELRNFIENVLPNYDEERVYASDIKKLASWYSVINEFVPPVIEEEKPKKTTTKKEPAKKESKAKDSSKKVTTKKAISKTAKKED